jgi:hypothetical protein
MQRKKRSIQDDVKARFQNRLKYIVELVGVYVHCEASKTVGDRRYVVATTASAIYVTC